MAPAARCTRVTMATGRNITTANKKPAPRPDVIGGHTLSMFVNNQPGVLMRICQIFARRAYNIDSLVVSQGRDPHFSRMTIGLKGAPQGLEQIIKQVSKLIEEARKSSMVAIRPPNPLKEDAPMAPAETTADIPSTVRRLARSRVSSTPPIW